MSPTLTFVEADGAEKAIAYKAGATLMASVTQAGVEGVLAECGGACSCSTCHVILTPEDFARLPAPAEDEDQLLEFVAAGRTPTSRLSCQIVLGAEDEGMRVRAPETQI